MIICEQNIGIITMNMFYYVLFVQYEDFHEEKAFWALTGTPFTEQG